VNARFVVPLLFPLIVSAQPAAQENVHRTLYFKHTGSVQHFQEIATVIRAIADIRQLSVDATVKALLLHGTAGQIGLAEWLFSRMDQAPNRQSQLGQDMARQELRLSGEDENVVRVFYLANTEGAQNLQEIATLVRSMTDVRRLFTYTALNAITLRGSAEQIRLAEWLVKQVDLSIDQVAVPQPGLTPDPYRYPGPDGGENFLRVFYLPQIETRQHLQEIAAHVRTTTAVRRLFTYNAIRAMAVRGTVEQIALADRMIRERQR